MDSIIELDVEIPSELDGARSSALKAKPIRNKILPPDESAEFGPEDIMEIPLLVRHDSLNIGRRHGRNRQARSRSLEHRTAKPMMHQQKKDRCHDFYDRGFCMRGDKCRYNHGQHPVVLNDFNFLGELKNSCLPSFNQSYCSNVPYVGAPDNRDLMPSTFNDVSSPNTVPKVPFNTPASLSTVQKVHQNVKAYTYHPYSKVFSKSYGKSITVSKANSQPVKKNSLLRTLLDVHRRRTELYKEQVDQQRLLLIKMQGVEDSESKGKYLKLIKKNNELLKTLKSEIEFLSQDIIAMRSKQKIESTDENSAMAEANSTSVIHGLVKLETVALKSEKI